MRWRRRIEKSKKKKTHSFGRHSDADGRTMETFCGIYCADASSLLLSQLSNVNVRRQKLPRHTVNVPVNGDCVRRINLMVSALVVRRSRRPYKYTIKRTINYVDQTITVSSVRVVRVCYGVALIAAVTTYQTVCVCALLRSNIRNICTYI
jgi:hypothetical protein